MASPLIYDIIGSMNGISDADFYIEVEDRMGLRHISYGIGPIGHNLASPNFVRLGNENYEVEGTVIDKLINDFFEQEEKIKKLETTKNILLLRLNLLNEYLAMLEEGLGDEWERSDKNQEIWERLSKKYTGKKELWMDLKLETQSCIDDDEIKEVLEPLFKEFVQYQKRDRNNEEEYRKLQKKFNSAFSEDSYQSLDEYGLPF